jgi:hypothetical protein
MSSLSNAVTLKKPASVSKNLLPPSSGLGIPCGKDGVGEQLTRLCERTNGRWWCQEGSANILNRKMRKIIFKNEKNSIR